MASEMSSRIWVSKESMREGGLKEKDHSIQERVDWRCLGALSPISPKLKAQRTNTQQDPEAYASRKRTLFVRGLLLSIYPWLCHWISLMPLSINTQVCQVLNKDEHREAFNHDLMQDV